MIDCLTKQIDVSIIIPYFNNSTTIKETLTCLSSQSFQKFEVILIEDKNSLPLDDKIINASYPFDFIYKKNVNKAGAAANRNLGFEYVKGDYIQFLDADDLISPEKIEIQYSNLKTNENSISFCKWAIFENNIGEASIEDSILYSNFNALNFLELLNGTFSVLIPLHSYLIPKFMIEKAGPWDECLSLGDDGEFMNRVIAQCHNLVYCEECIAFYRRGNLNSLSHKNDLASAKSNLLCAISYENLIINTYGSDKKKMISIIRKYNLLFLWSYRRFPEIAMIVEERIFALGGKLDLIIGGGFFGKIIHHIIGTKYYLDIKHLIMRKLK